MIVLHFDFPLYIDFQANFTGSTRNCLADVIFNGPVSSIRQSAFKKGHINKGTNIHFKLEEEEPGWFGTAHSQDSAYVFAFSDHNGTRRSKSDTWCIGFGYNGTWNDKENHHRIIDHFRKDIHPTADVEAYLTHDWANDPYAKGAWACWGPGCASKLSSGITEIRMESDICEC